MFVSPAVPAHLRVADGKIDAEGPVNVVEVKPAEVTPAELTPEELATSQDAEHATQSTVSSLPILGTEDEASIMDTHPNLIQIDGMVFNLSGVCVNDLFLVMDTWHVNYYAAFIVDPKDEITLPPSDALDKFYLHPSKRERATALAEIERHRDISLYGHDARFNLDPSRRTAGLYMFNVEVSFITNEMLVESIVQEGQSRLLHFHVNTEDEFAWPFCKVWRYAAHPHDSLRQTLWGSGTALEATLQAYIRRAEKRRGGEKANIVVGFTNQLDDKFVVSDLQVGRQLISPRSWPPRPRPPPLTPPSPHQLPEDSHVTQQKFTNTPMYKMFGHAVTTGGNRLYFKPRLTQSARVYFKRLVVVIAFGNQLRARPRSTTLTTRPPLVPAPSEERVPRATVKEEATPALVANAAPADATPCVKAPESDNEDVFAARSFKKRRYDFEPVVANDGNIVEAVQTRAAIFLAEMMDDVQVSLNVVTQILVSNDWDADDAVDRVIAHYYQ